MFPHLRKKSVGGREETQIMLAAPYTGQPVYMYKMQSTGPLHKLANH